MTVQYSIVQYSTVQGDTCTVFRSGRISSVYIVGVEPVAVVEVVVAFDFVASDQE